MVKIFFEIFEKFCKIRCDLEVKIIYRFHLQQPKSHWPEGQSIGYPIIKACVFQWYTLIALLHKNKHKKHTPPHKQQRKQSKIYLSSQHSTQYFPWAWITINVSESSLYSIFYVWFRVLLLYGSNGTKWFGLKHWLVGPEAHRVHRISNVGFPSVGCSNGSMSWWNNCRCLKYTSG